VSLGWTVQEDAYLVVGTFSFPVSLASTTFTDIGTNQTVLLGCSGIFGCSGTLTEKYIITATGFGVTQDGIIVETPAPALGAGLWLWRCGADRGLASIVGQGWQAFPHYERESI